ncbi:MAG: DUF4340 domain-containing protein [Gammaproteobacteria bacterium]|nr:DUF4340 domain-containing protein [Gammaproteobacteria bacterium]
MLSRRMIINFVLVFLIILLTWVGNRFNVQPGFQPELAITEIEATDIASMEIKTADASLTLGREGDGWVIETPIRWPANNVNIERMIDIVNSQTESRLDAAEIDLATLGLDFPKAMIRLNDTRVLFGATNNIGERRYTMIDSTVYLLPDIHLPFVSQGLTGIVDRRLLPRKLGLKSLKLPDLQLIRNADDSWQQDASNDFSEQQIAQLVGSWQGLGAKRIKVYNANVTPRQKIHAELEDGRNQVFYLMSIDPEIIIANPQIGLQYHFSVDFYYQLIALRHDENPA